MQTPKAPSFPIVLAVVVLAAILSPAAAQTVIFVDASATGAGNGSSWADAYTAVQPALNAAQPGDQVWVAAGTYVENITLALDVGLYGGLAGTEDPAIFNLADRDLAANQTLIDGNYHGSVVTAPAGATDSTRIDGFTIVRGGTGVDCDGSSPTIATNVIKGNGKYSVGTGIYLYGSSAIIMNNTITANSTMRGAGVYIEASSPTITNNTITGNSARYGGGVYVDMSTASTPTITNTIIAFNSSGIYATGSAGTALLRHNCVYGNLQYDYSGLGDPTGTEGNLSADPRLASWEFGNVHIQPDSPCVNAGDDAYAYGNSDVDGQPRIQPMGGTVDIGADESDGTTWPVGPYAVVRVSPTGDDNHDGSSWELAKQTVQAGIDAACRSGGEVWVHAGRYEEGIVLHPYAYLYGGFAGGETQRDERDWNANVTTLDGRQNATVVLAFAGHRVSAINGFTIANSSPQSWYTSGGGLYLSSASPTIMNNTIVANNATYGGGIGAFASFAIIAHNRIMGNRTANHLYVDGGNDLRRGGGLYLMYGSPIVVNNTISGNSGGLRGGGVYLSGCSGLLANNTITGNNAESAGGLCLSNVTMTLANNIIAFNSSGLRAEGGGSLPALTHNCVHGNGAYNYDGMTDPTGTDGNISADPQLAGWEYGNLHIQPDSPCADAGDNTHAYGEADMDGQPRIQPAGGTVDIGADESDGTTWPAGPCAIVRVSPTGDDEHDGSSWGQAKQTVQAGIEAASRIGGEVWAQAGTYEECITLHPYAHLYGGFAGGETHRDERDWNVNVTTLDGQQQGSVVTVQAGYRISTIDGFAITNGSGTIPPHTSSDTYGGGLYVQNASPTIENSTISGNAARFGGGLALYYASPSITNNTIAENNATGGQGGGFYLYHSSAGIANNTVADNMATGDYYDYEGGGFYLYASPAVITENRITGNKAVEGFGGGLYLDASSAMITHNIITNNSTPGSFRRGGGLHLSNSSAEVANNCIMGNKSHYGGGLYVSGGSSLLAGNRVAGNIASSGGGLEVSGGSSTITNNIVAANIASHAGGLYLDSSASIVTNNTIAGNTCEHDAGGLQVSGGSPTIANTIVAFNSSGIELSSGTPTLRHNCVYGNDEYDYDGLPNPTGIDGNISSDPQFADLKYGNFHIQPASPCVEVGDNAHAHGDVDTDGQPRIQPAGGTVDIGADESDGTVWPAGPGVIVRVSPSGDDTHDGSSWILAKRTVQAGIDTACASSGEVWVQAGAYPECVLLHPYVCMYGGFAGGETQRHERDWIANVTILDGRQQGSVVTARGGLGFSAIDGFTITNGSGTFDGSVRLGGGLYLSQASPTVANNTITGNTANRGGGVYLSSSSATITNNEIRHNRVSGAAPYPGLGAALYSGSSSPMITNNTITGNSAVMGLGALFLSDSSAAIANTIVAFNSAGIHGGAQTLRHNCVFGNTMYNYSNLPDPTGTDGNISVDPLFVQTPDPGPDGTWATDDDLPGDLHLLINSPCIDAGDNAYVFGDFDLDGLPRIAWCNADIGAHEYQGPFGDFLDDCDVDLEDYALLEVCLRFSGPDVLPPFDECLEIFDFDLDFDVDLTDFAVFQLVFTQP